MTTSRRYNPTNDVGMAADERGRAVGGWDSIVDRAHRSGRRAMEDWRANRDAAVAGDDVALRHSAWLDAKTWAQRRGRLAWFEARFPEPEQPLRKAWRKSRLFQSQREARLEWSRNHRDRDRAAWRRYTAKKTRRRQDASLKAARRAPQVRACGWCAAEWTIIGACRRLYCSVACEREERKRRQRLAWRARDRDCDPERRGVFVSKVTTCLGCGAAWCEIDARGRGLTGSRPGYCSDQCQAATHCARRRALRESKKRRSALEEREQEMRNHRAAEAVSDAA